MNRTIFPLLLRRRSGRVGRASASKPAWSKRKSSASPSWKSPEDDRASVVYAVGPVVAKQYLGGAGAWAAILTVGGIGSAVGGLAVIRLRPKRPLSAAMLCCVPFSMMPLAVALALPVPVLCAISAIAGTSVVLTQTLFDTVVQTVVDPDVLSCVFAIDLSLSQIGLPLGLFIGGLLEPSLGGRTVLVAAGTGATAMCLLTAARRPIRDMRLDPLTRVDRTDRNPPLDPNDARH